MLATIVGSMVSGDPATSPLRSVQRLTVVTSHGSSKLVNVLQGEPGRQLWKRTVLGLCAPNAAFDWISLYKIDRLDLEARRAFLVEVERQVGSITRSLVDDNARTNFARIRQCHS